MSDAGPTPMVTYAERWLKLKGSAVGALDEETARERHERGELYTAMLGTPERPHAYLDIRLEAGFVGVHFLDRELRNHLTYHFTRPPESADDLFLKQVFRQQFGGSGELSFDEHYVFNPPNLAYVKKRDHSTQEAEKYQIETELDQNYEPVPAFGGYDSIARLER